MEGLSDSGHVDHLQFNRLRLIEDDTSLEWQEQVSLWFVGLGLMKKSGDGDEIQLLICIDMSGLNQFLD